MRGNTLPIGIGVRIEQCFLHCAKAFRRAYLWSVDHWPEPDALPSLACVLFDQIKPDGVTLQDYERDIEESNKTRLY